MYVKYRVFYNFPVQLPYFLSYISKNVRKKCDITHFLRTFQEMFPALVQENTFLYVKNRIINVFTYISGNVPCFSTGKYIFVRKKQNN